MSSQKRSTLMSSYRPCRQSWYWRWWRMPKGDGRQQTEFSGMELRFVSDNRQAEKFGGEGLTLNMFGAPRWPNGDICALSCRVFLTRFCSSTLHTRYRFVKRSIVLVLVYNMETSTLTNTMQSRSCSSTGQILMKLVQFDLLLTPCNNLISTFSIVPTCRPLIYPIAVKRSQYWSQDHIFSCGCSY